MTIPKNNHDTQNSTNKSNTAKFVTAGILIGGFVTLIALKLFPALFLSNAGLADTSTSIDENKPLYWVAPMDANYQRDQPGQSPMGMDLIPYYGSQNNTIDEGAGTIKISPSVINNLGVRTTTATYGELNTTIETVGYVTYDEDKLVHIHPRIAGWIETSHQCHWRPNKKRPATL